MIYSLEIYLEPCSIPKFKVTSVFKTGRCKFPIELRLEGIREPIGLGSKGNQNLGHFLW